MSLFRDDLAEFTLFSEASGAERAVIRRYLTQLPITAGRVLVSEGARGAEFMIIAEGEAIVSQGGHTIAKLGPGDLVGEMALLDSEGFGRRNATVTVLTDGLIYVGSRAEFRRILDAAPSVARKIRQTAETRTASRAA